MLYPEVEIDSIAAGGARERFPESPMHLRAVPKGACVSEDRVPGAYVLAAPGDTGMTHQGSGQCPCNVSGPIWS
jgi:hypothetical protein